MDTIAMFKQAATALQQDERYLKLAEARQKNDDNQELQNLIGEFNLVRLELNNEMEKEPHDEARVKTLDDKVSGLYNSIMTNSDMLAYNEAKEGIQALMNHINAILSAAIDGEDPAQVAEPVAGCSADGCSSCSGCG